MINIKEQVLVVGCEVDMIDKCMACTRCLKAFNDRDDEFKGLSPSAELIIRIKKRMPKASTLFIHKIDCGSAGSCTIFPF